MVEKHKVTYFFKQPDLELVERSKTFDDVEQAIEFLKKVKLSRDLVGPPVLEVI